MKKFAAVAALCAVILCAAGCKDNTSESISGVSSAEESNSTNNDNTTQGSSQTDEEQAESVLTSTLSEDTVVISSEKGGEEMNITFGDFLKEYKYYLASYGISSDTDPTYAATLTSRREYTANYLINEKLMEVIFAELCPEGFTDEELAQIQTDAEAGIDQMVAAIKQQLSDSQPLGSEVTDEELQQQAEEGFQQLMDNCGLTREDFNLWQRATTLRERLIELAGEGVECSREEAETSAQTMVKQAQEEYESDPANYNPDDYSSVYIPEGSRYVKHILIKFDTDTIDEIDSLRTEGKDEEADAIRTEKLKELESKFSEAQEKVNAGEDFEKLMEEYSEDSDLTISYLVVPDTKLYVDGFAECVFGIEEVGGTATCATDYGYHIIKYTEAGEVSEENYNSTVDGLQSYFTDYYKTQKLSELLTQKRSEYAFTIDRQALLLESESAE